MATSRTRSDLAVLRLQGAAPAPAGTQFYVANSRITVRNVAHPDPGVTPYLRLTFPTGSLATVGGTAAGSTDSVLITLQHVSGSYEFVMGVTQAATFSATNTPSATFFYGTYGDFAGSRTGTRYNSNAELAQALGLWREEIIDRFSQVAGSGPGTDAVSGVLAGPGTYLLAAPR